jgi:hypothetical protein
MAQAITISQRKRTVRALIFLGALLVVVLALAARAERGKEGMLSLAAVGIALTFTLGGVTLSVLLFTQDADLRIYKQAVVGIATGAGAVKIGELLDLIRQRVAWAHESVGSNRALGVGFFLNAATAIIGAHVGFLLVRFWLDRAIAEEKLNLDTLVSGVKAPEGLPWNEAKKTTGSALPEAHLKQLEHISDWTDVPGPTATRAGQALLQEGRAEQALAPLEYAVMNIEPPSPEAFDLFAAALAQAARYRDIDGDRAERAIGRMLTYWDCSYLVNLDIGYLYLYVPGRADLAAHYSRRALKIRPRSPSASLNLACALAAQVGAQPDEAKVDEITRLLDVSLTAKPLVLGTFDAQGDFDELKKVPRFADWLRRWRSSQQQPTEKPTPNA